MKKIISLFFLALMVTNSFAASFIKNSISFSELRDNQDFIEMVTKEKELTNLIFESLNYDELKIDAAKKQIEELQSENLTNEEAVRKINEILNFPTGKSIQEYYTLFSTNWNSVKGAFGEKLTDEYVKQEAAEVYKALPSDYDCKDKPGFVLCSAGVTAAAVVAHAACVGTLFGMFVCFAIVATVQTAGINECSRNYCGAALTEKL